MLCYILLYYTILNTLIKTDHSGSWGGDSVGKVFAAQVWDSSENQVNLGTSVCAYNSSAPQQDGGCPRGLRAN